MGDAERVKYEAQLRVAVLAGDEAAWRTWYDAVAPEITRYVRWRCGGLNHLADDVLQDTWMTAVRKIRTFNPREGSFRQWVSGVAANTLRNHLRKHVRSSLRHQPLVGHEVAPSLSGDDRAFRTANALAELNPRYESALRAKYLDGRSVIEIANASGESPKAIESLLSRARDAFRAAYEEAKNADG